MTTIDTSRAAVERVLDEELIARLRKAENYEWQDRIWETRLAAANRIEALLARAEAAEAERDGLLRCVTDNHVALQRAEAAESALAAMTRERDAERETVARLTEALRVIATARDLEAPSEYNRGWNDARARLRDAARAALTQKEQADDE